MWLFNLLFSSLYQTWYVEVRISRSVSVCPLEFEITRVYCISYNKFLFAPYLLQMITLDLCPEVMEKREVTIPCNEATDNILEFFVDIYILANSEPS